MARDPLPASPPSFSKPALVLTKGVNVLLTALLRSPWHGLLSQKFLNLIFHGRKTGKRYALVVGYHYDGDMLKVISPRNSNRLSRTY